MHDNIWPDFQIISNLVSYNLLNSFTEDKDKEYELNDNMVLHEDYTKKWNL